MCSIREMYICSNNVSFQARFIFVPVSRTDAFRSQILLSQLLQILHLSTNPTAPSYVCLVQLQQNKHMIKTQTFVFT